MTAFFKDRKILVTGGTARESIDGMRHYANHARPGCLGHRTAALLAEQGAKVFLVSARNAYPVPSGVTLFAKNLSSEDMLKTAQGIITSEKIDTCLHLANISSIRAEKPAHQKKQMKSGGRGEFEFGITVNAGFHDALRTPIYAGFGRQKQFSRGDADITTALWDIVGQAENQPSLKTEYPISAKEYAPSLSGLKIIVTAGATAEKVTDFGDVISRHASVSQGYAVAAALAQMGAQVTLISSRTSLSLPHKNVTVIKIESAFELLAAVQRSLPADAFIGCAAIADFMTMEPLKKLHKAGETMKLYFMPSPDVLETVGKLPQNLRPRLVIGFAGATEGLMSHAQEKLESKNIDALCALPADRDTKEISFISRSGMENWGAIEKRMLGIKIGDRILPLLKNELRKSA